MKNYENQIRKLFVAIKNRAGDNLGYVRVDNNAKFLDMSKAVEYIMDVEDVRSISVFGKDGKSLGVFGLEPANYEYDIFDIVYDYSDNDFCNGVMGLLR